MHNKETICVDCLQIRLNRYILLAIGLWPYQQSKLTKLYLMLCIGIIASFIILQLLVIFKYSSDVLINVFSSVLIYITFSIKFVSLIVYNKVVKYMVEQLHRLYNELTDKNEISIIKRYSNYAKLYTITLTSASLFGIVVLSFLMFWPIIYDVVYVRNGTQSRISLPITIVYFVDQEKYGYLILIHMHTCIIIGFCSIIGAGTFLIAYLQHVCGMFKIASYRFARVTILSRITARQKKNSHNEDLIYKGIVYALNMQRKAVEYYTVFLTSFGQSYFFLVVIGVFCISLHFFQLLSFEFKSVLEFFLTLKFTLTLVSYTLICNWIAQDVINHNNDVYVATYNFQWYTAPLQIQKLIVFILLRSNKPFCVNVAGGLITGSIENAASVLSTAISYCIVLQSIKH